MQLQKTMHPTFCLAIPHEARTRGGVGMWAIICVAALCLAEHRMGVANDLRFCRFSHRKLIILLPTFHIIYSNFPVVKFVCNVLFPFVALLGFGLD